MPQMNPIYWMVVFLLMVVFLMMIISESHTSVYKFKSMVYKKSPNLSKRSFLSDEKI